ncbi:MAG TPA: hypothetical protein VNH16_02890, partial [Burkholderiales bacterium]|nr:hypothetical protein [Burkholderiales bacterium]
PLDRERRYRLSARDACALCRVAHIGGRSRPMVRTVGERVGLAGTRAGDDEQRLRARPRGFE